MDVAWKVLAHGGSALDAVEVAVRCVEDDTDDHTVGYGGYPNLLGEVELDASIMDGTTRNAGAVGALKGYRHPISVARAVMERLPHVLLVGDGAARFAAEIGLQTEDLLTDHARQAYLEGLAGRLPPEYRNATAHTEALIELAATAIDPEHVTGTVNVVAQDHAGRIASAVSTSGWAWKYPGRLGDTPIIGAGNYADDRYGAAACTGWGELAIRTSTARSIIHNLSQGHDLHRACKTALDDLNSLRTTPTDPAVHLLAIDRAGNHTSYSSTAGRHYLAWTDAMTAYQQVPCIVIEEEK
jgi:beta-aspartyl-peptidase (threonine type)